MRALITAGHLMYGRAARDGDRLRLHHGDYKQGAYKKETSCWENP
jgi:hypothetical protein